MTDQTPPPVVPIEPAPDPTRPWLHVGAVVAMVRLRYDTDRPERVSVVTLAEYDPERGWRARFRTPWFDPTSLQYVHPKHDDLVYELRPLTDPAVIDHRAAETITWLVQERWTNDEITNLTGARQRLDECAADIETYRKYLDLIEQGDTF